MTLVEVDFRRGAPVSMQVSVWLAVVMILIAAFLGALVVAASASNGVEWRDMSPDELHERAHKALGLPPPLESPEDIFGDPLLIAP